MQNRIDITKTRKQEIYPLPKEHFYGKSPSGKELGFTNYYMTMDGEPFLAISGECHYSRVAESSWEDTLRKMKAGGISVVATYIFWNHHEEKEGVFRFDGNRNIRKFVELCGKEGLYVILRIGPFDHGEVRNGGLPDWLYGKPFDVRSDNEGFLAYTRILYRQIAGQVKGLFFQDGGPIIGAQIENEYMHSSAPWEMTTGISGEWCTAGEDGCTYMKKLMEIARQEGITPPFHTCTGWGGAATPTDVMMPLWGGYAYWPWMSYGGAYVHPATPEYLYRDNHNNAVPSTYNFDPTYEPESRPYACCEMGGGMMNTYNYRFQLDYGSVDAMANIKLASGCNFLGYYMYRGGSNPTGETTGFLNEGQCPKISYDYQAPIGEFGQLRPSYYRLRLIHRFTEAFGALLCDMVTMLPEGSQDIDPADQGPLRFAMRTDGKSGFLFLNNYQDHVTCRDKEAETVIIKMEEETVTIPGISLAAGENAILPVNLNIGGMLLRYATAQPLSILNEKDGKTYVFFTPENMESRFVFADGETITCKKGERSVFTKDCPEGNVRFVVLTRQESLQYTEIPLKEGTIAFLSENPAIWDNETLYVESFTDGKEEVAVTSCGKNRYLLTLPEIKEGVKDALLRIDYSGDIGNLFDKAGHLLNDNFSNEAIWEVGLKEIGASAGEKLTLYITPRKKDVVVDVSSTMAGRSEKAGEAFALLRSVTIRYIQEKQISLKGSREEILNTLQDRGMERIC